MSIILFCVTFYIDLPAENGITPTTAHAALKNIISELVEECQEIPPLQVQIFYCFVLF